RRREFLPFALVFSIGGLALNPAGPGSKLSPSPVRPGSTMQIDTECPLCGHKGKVPPVFEGKQVKCPECLNQFLVSGAAVAANAKTGGSHAGNQKLPPTGGSQAGNQKIKALSGSHAGTQKVVATGGSQAGTQKVAKPGGSHAGTQKVVK